MGVVVHDLTHAAILDTDGDGVVTDNELQAFLAQRSGTGSLARVGSLDKLQNQCQTRWELQRAKDHTAWAERQARRQRWPIYGVGTLRERSERETPEVWGEVCSVRRQKVSEKVSN